MFGIFKSARRIIQLALYFLIFTLGLGATGYSSAHAQADSFEQYADLIAKAKNEGVVRVIVGLGVPVTPEGELSSSFAIQRQRLSITMSQQALSQQAETRGGKTYVSWPEIPFMALEVDEAAPQLLIGSQSIISIEEDRATLASSTAVNVDTYSPFGLADKNPGIPTGLGISSFTAFPKHASILVAWQTNYELDMTGFNLYRATAIDGATILLTTVPSKGFGGLTDYQFVDSDISPGTEYFYWLGMLTTNDETMHGPISETASFIAYLPLIK